MSYLSQKLKLAVATVYAPDNFDPARMKLNGEPVNLHYDPSAAYEDYLLHPTSLIAAFLGLPSRLTLKKQSWANIWHNFSGMEFVNWRTKDASLTDSVRNLIEATVITSTVTMLHIIKLLFKLPVSLIAVATELLPALGQVLFEDLADRAARSRNPLINTVGYGVAMAGYLMFSGLHFIGRATTSPMQALTSAYYEGKAMTASLIGSDTRVKKWAGRILGVGLILMSAAITGTIYTFAFPAAAHLIATTVAPAIAGHLPTVANHALQALSWVDTNIIKNVGIGFRNSLQAVGIGVSPTAALLAGKGLIRLAQTGLKSLFGFGVDKAKRASRERLNTPTNSPRTSQENIAVEGSTKMIAQNTSKTTKDAVSEFYCNAKRLQNTKPASTSDSKEKSPIIDRISGNNSSLFYATPKRQAKQISSGPSKSPSKTH